MGAIKQTVMEMVDDITILVIKDKYGDDVYKDDGFRLKDNILDEFQELFDQQQVKSLDLMKCITVQLSMVVQVERILPMRKLLRVKTISLTGVRFLCVTTVVRYWRLNIIQK